jgi:hypothetical protein
MFWSIESRAQSSLLNLDVNLGSRSDMILLGNPKCGNTCVAYKVAIPSESMVLLQGRNMAAFV